MPAANETAPLPVAAPGAAGRFIKRLLLVSLPLYLLDQATKWLVTHRIDEPFTVIPGWFDLVSVSNTGAAFGMFTNSNRGFLALSILALIVLAVLYRQGAFDHALSRAGFFLLIPGVLGNLTDRLVRGHVVDFLSFDLHVPGAHPWPAFNVADGCICVAAASFILVSLLDLRRPRATMP